MTTFFGNINDTLVSIETNVRVLVNNGSQPFLGQKGNASWFSCQCRPQEAYLGNLADHTEPDWHSGRPKTFLLFLTLTVHLTCWWLKVDKIWHQSWSSSKFGAVGLTQFWWIWSRCRQSVLENRFIQSIIIIYIFIIFLKITTAQILGFGGHGVTHGHEERVNTGAKNFFEKCILIHLNVFKACGRGGDKKND